MEPIIFEQPIQLRWADFDANFHVRHSIYYDWCAMHRLDYLYTHGVTATAMAELGFGPILFKEEAQFRREIKMNESLKVNLMLLRARKDLSRWTIRHHITKDDGTVAAIITVDGAWMDTAIRKLAAPPALARLAFTAAPKADSFEWIG